MIPQYLDEIDAVWLTEALSVRHPGVRVVDCHPASEKPGAGQKVWVKVSYDDAGGSLGIPESLVVKGGFLDRNSDDPAARAWSQMTAGLNAAEARFYRDFAPEVSADIPECYFADTDVSSSRSAVILEDLVAAGATFGSFDQPLGPDVAAQVLDSLAELHARWWADPVLKSPELKDPLVEEGGLLHFFLAKENWDAQMARPRGERVPLSLQDYDRVATAIRSMWELQFEEPLCLLHGDPHIGNLYFRPTGAVGLLDWQVCCRGTWATDVAYFLVGALSIEDRRTHERTLLDRYLDGLRGNGVEAPSADEVWVLYRRRLFHGFMNFLTPGDGIQTEEYNSTMGERFAIAIEDLDAFAALDVRL